MTKLPDTNEQLEKAGDVEPTLAAVLVELYNEQDFNRLCQLDNFIRVQNQFTLEMPLSQRAGLLVQYCESNGLRPELLEQIKKRNAERYRQFVTAQISQIFGLPSLPANLDITLEAVRQEYERVIAAQPSFPPPTIEGMEDFSFHDRDDYCARIIQDRPRYLEMYGPRGCGKTHILRHIQERGQNLRVTYVGFQTPAAPSQPKNGGTAVQPPQSALETARRTLNILEQQAAGYGSLSAPANLLIELEDKRREVMKLEKDVQTAAPAPGSFQFEPQSREAETPETVILRQMIAQLGGKGDTLAALARLMAQLQRSAKVNHFIFAFDFDTVEPPHRQVIEWLVSPEGLVKSHDFEHQKLYQLLKNHGVATESLTVQVLVAARKPVAQPNWSTKFNPRAIEITPLAPSEDLLNRDPVLLMLKEIAEKRGFDCLPDDAARQIADEVYYHTGGHPKCAKLVLYAAAKNDFLCDPPEVQGWPVHFQRYVIPTIRDELLSSVPASYIPIFWMLSVFRQFNPHLLASLISRGFLPGAPGKEDRDYASELLGKLKETQLIQDPAKGFLHTMNPVARRTLLLSMQYFNPARFRLLNTLALEIYTDWLQREPLSGERPIMIFIEIVYHCLKLLESDPSLKLKVQAAIAEEYLPHLLQAIDHMDPEDYKNNRLDYLPQLKAYWSDKELIATARRATGTDDFHTTLTTLLEEFVEKNLS